MYLESPVFVLEQERINVKCGREVECIIDFLKSQSFFVVLYSMNLKKESLGRSLDPAVFFDTNHLSFFIPVVINVGDGDFFESVVELTIFGHDK